MQIHARRFDNGHACKVAIEGDRIAAIENLPVAPGSIPPATAHAGTTGVFVAPGFIDIQINGYLGQEFSSQALTPTKVADIVQHHNPFGVAAMCPTLTTASPEVLSHGLSAIAAACEEWPALARRIPCIHLEGPFMSPEDGPRGAHPAADCKRPDWDLFSRLQDAARGRIGIITMSVEFDESPEFIRRAVKSGVVVSIGHTAADGAHIRAAVDAGATLSTHLGNGAHRMLRRHPNYLWDQLAEDRLMASLIVDGHHLPPEVVKSFVRGKTPPRCILVSDESGLAGLPPGRYQSSGCELEILPDGRLVIAGQDQLLAGASRPIGDNVFLVMQFAGVDLATAVEMATVNPARLLSLPEPALRPGQPANLVVFELTASELIVHATVVDGKIVHGALPA